MTEPNSLVSRDGFVSGSLHVNGAAPGAPLLVCIHGGGCNGRYFDLRGCSTVQAARARGFTVLALDRPGYAGNPPLRSDSPIRDSAPVIRDFLDEVRSEHLSGCHDVVLIGHSIGGAIATLIAAAPESLPLRAIAISGIGDRAPGEFRAIHLPQSEVRVPPPPELTERLFHDPHRSMKWQAVASLRAAAEDWLVAEVQEVVWQWPEYWRGYAEEVRVPVHIRLAEGDRIWETSEDVIARMEGAFESGAGGRRRPAPGWRPSLRGHTRRPGNGPQPTGFRNAALGPALVSEQLRLGPVTGRLGASMSRLARLRCFVMPDALVEARTVEDV